MCRCNVLLKLYPSVLGLFERALGDFSQTEPTCHVESNLLQLEVDALMVVAAQGHELVVAVLRDHALEHLQASLGVVVLLALGLRGQLQEQVAREDLGVCVLVEAPPAAKPAHEARERPRNLLKDEHDAEDTNARAVEDCVDLAEAVRVGTCCRCDTRTNRFCIEREELDNAALLLVFVAENRRVRKHVEPHEEVGHERPLDDAAGLVRQVRTVTGRQAVVLDEQQLVGPVGRQTEQSARQVEHGHDGGEHHDGPDHGDVLGEAVVVLDLSAEVDLLVLGLNDFLGLLLVAGAASVEDASFGVADSPLVYDGDGREAVDQACCEDRNTDNAIPFGIKVVEFSIKCKTMRSGSNKGPSDNSMIRKSVIDNEENDSGVNELQNPHFRERRSDSSSSRVMAFHE